MSNYGSFEDALSDYGILDDLGLSPEMTQVIPPALGVTTALVVPLAVRYFLKSRPSSAWYTYANLIGAAGALGAAYALWKYQGRGAAITAATAGVATSLLTWVMPKLEAKALGAYVAEEPVPVLQGYEVETARPVIQGLGEPPQLLSDAPELLSEAPELLSEAPEVVSGVQGWSAAFV